MSILRSHSPNATVVVSYTSHILQHDIDDYLGLVGMSTKLPRPDQSDQLTGLSIDI